MRQTDKGENANTLSRKLMMVYILVVLPGSLLYFSLHWFTQLRGRQLFNAFLPSALVFVILYLLYLLWPLLKHLGLKDTDELIDPQENNNVDKNHTN